MEKSKRGGKSVEMTIKFWWDPKDRSIHIRGEGRPASLISTVNANPGSKRGNPNLFEKLAKCLRQAGAPAPEPATAANVRLKRAFETARRRLRE